jgi:hypothetical protein
VSSCTITSGSADATAWATASGSRASATTGRAPRLRTRSCFDPLLVIPTTSWPRATSCGTSSLPRTHVAPATKTFMTAPFVSFPLRRDGGAACDSAQRSVLSAHVPQRRVRSGRGGCVSRDAALASARRLRRTPAGVAGTAAFVRQWERWCPVTARGGARRRARASPGCRARVEPRQYRMRPVEIAPPTTVAERLAC